MMMMKVVMVVVLMAKVHGILRYKANDGFIMMTIMVIMIMLVVVVIIKFMILLG